MAVAPVGIDIRATDDRLVFRALLQDSAGALVTSGTATLYLYELQDDGDLASYDFDDNTFKTTALTTETVNLVKQTGNNGGTETGIYTYALTTLSGFTEGAVYFARVNHASASPVDQVREFQFGGVFGDLAVTSGNLHTDVKKIEAADPTDTIKTQVDTALADIHLDHLLSVALADDGDIANDSALAQIMASDGDFSGYDKSTDSLEAIRDRGDAAWTPGAGGTPPTAAEVADAVWDEATADHQSAGTTGKVIDEITTYVKSIMSKAQSPPAAVGTYDKATDSLEALRERLDSAMGGGFATGTDSLQAIRDAIDTLVAPVVVSSSALSGSGFLSDCVSMIRQKTDEPNVSPKYTDADLVSIIQAAFDVVLADINVVTDHPILVRWNVSIVDGKQSYTLPPNCGQIWRFAKINTTTNVAEWEVWPNNHFCYDGYGFTIEGNTLRLLRDWNESDTLEVLYVPSSEVYLHKGTAAGSTTTTLTFAATPTDGTLDTRANCYAGYMLRILSDDSSIVQERIITAYDNSTKIATVTEAFSPTLAGTIVYEVLPWYSNLLKNVVCMRASLDILGNEGNIQRMQTQERSYMVQLAALRRTVASKLARWHHVAQGDTSDNTNRIGLF